MPASTPPSCDTPNGRLRSTGSTSAPYSSRSEPAAWSADRKTSSSTSPSTYSPPVSRKPGQLPPNLPRARPHGPSRRRHAQLAPNAMRSNSHRASDLVRQAGFEPATRCLAGTLEASRYVARCRPMNRSPALMGAGGGLAPPEDWDCWLPIRLPDIVGFCVVRMDENCIGCAAGCGVALVGMARAALAARWQARAALRRDSAEPNLLAGQGGVCRRQPVSVGSGFVAGPAPLGGGVGP